MATAAAIFLARPCVCVWDQTGIYDGTFREHSNCKINGVIGNQLGTFPL